jgi:hypothetical protein
MIIVLAPSALAADAGDELQSKLDQAQFFIKKGWFDDAERELDAAVATPDGRISPDAWYLLATVRFELCELEAAREAAARAHSYARTDDQLQQAASFEQFLLEGFGVVEIRAPYEGMTGRVKFELETPLFDPALKDYLERLREAHQGKLLFPVRLGLPAGTYTINDQPMVVAAGSNKVLDLPAGALDTGRMATAQLAKAEIAFGGSFWLGKEVSHLLPAPTVELSVSQPVGPVVAGLLVDWGLRGFGTVDDGRAVSAVDWTVGGRVGRDLASGGPVVVRPSLGVRYGYLPGIALPCGRDGPHHFACADGADQDLVIYGIGRTIVPFAEVSIDVYNRERKNGLGFGVKIAGEHAFGMLPSGSIAKLPDGDTVGYAVDGGSRAFQASGFRTLFNLTLAF